MLKSAPFFPPGRYARHAAFLAAALILACTPTLDWREVSGADGSFSALFPAKPTNQTRQVELAGAQVAMTMTAADADGVTYAVATALVSNQAAVKPALDAMKSSLLANIGGTVRKEGPAPARQGVPAATDLEAVGKPDPRSPRSAGQPLVLHARLASKDLRVFEAVVIGPEKSIKRDAVDLFFTSFKPN